MDFGRGLAEMGKTLMQSSSALVTESIRAGYDQDKLNVAAELQAAEGESSRSAAAKQNRLER